MKIQHFLRETPGLESDKRTKAAFDIFENNKTGNLLVYKTTRAGATTSLFTESINRQEKCVCLVPTNNIAAKTITRDSKKYCNIDNVDIVRVLSNHNCLYNVELCKKYPDLKKLPFLPLAENCTGCKHYMECPVTTIFRRPQADGIVLTYHKLAALLIASKTRENTTAEQVLESLTKAENLILDEVHELQNGKQESLKVYDGRTGETWNLKKYKNLPEKQFKWINEVLKRMQLLKEDEQIRTKIHEVKGGAEDKNFWKRHLRKKTINPCFEFNNQKQIEAIAVGTLKEAIELTKIRKEYDLSIEDILRIYKMMAIVTGTGLSINAIRERGIVKINLTCTDRTFQNMINSFVMSMQRKAKRTLLTSATICSFDYGKLFMGGVKPKNILFGESGDPMNTNSKMLLLADNKKYNAIGDRSRYKKRGEILTRILEILDFYEGHEIMIVTLNKKESEVLEEELEKAGKTHKVHYYKSPEMMGVEAAARILIAVGIANKPANSYDAITSSEEQSKKLLYESVHADTWQAMSRVKDPNGIEESVVFGLGCCVDDLRACVQWGFNREIAGIEDNQPGCRNQVKVRISGGEITKPKIIHCKTFEEMKEQALMFKQSKKTSVSDSKPSIYYIIDGLCSKSSVFLDSPLEMLKLMCNRRDTYGLQNETGAYTRSRFPLTDKDLQAHISGEKTIGTYQLNKEHQVSWIAFDVDSHAPKVKDPLTGKRVPKAETPEEIDKRNRIAEENKERLSNALNSLNIPFTLEASGSPFSFHFLIFLSKPIPASLAVFAGEEIKKIAGIVGDIELFPKQTKLTQKEFGNLLKMPFATHRRTGLKSKIFINGEFQENFEGLEIKTIDFSPLSELEQEQKEKIKEKVKKAKKEFKDSNPDFKPVKDGFLRPCFISSQFLQMDYGDGNQFRIAAAGEMYRAGYPLDVALQYFKYQADFDEEETRYRLSLVYEGNYRRTEQEKLKRLCTRFVSCDTCGYDGVCDYIGG